MSSFSFCFKMHHLMLSFKPKPGVQVAIFSRNFCSQLPKGKSKSIFVPDNFLSFIGRHRTPLDTCLKCSSIPKNIYVPSSKFHNTFWLNSNQTTQMRERRKNYIFIFGILTILAVYAGLSYNIVESHDNVFVEYTDNEQEKPK